MSRPTFAIAARGIKQTDMALLCEIEGEEIWVPQSVIHDDSEVYGEEDEGELVVFEWWAIEKGLL